MELRYCRKCLIRDGKGQQEYFQNLYKYIEGLEQELKVPAPVYDERLEACAACADISDGLCRVCGCYVELRAAMKKNACPSGNWDAYKGEEQDDFLEDI